MQRISRRILHPIVAALTAGLSFGLFAVPANAVPDFSGGSVTTTGGATFTLNSCNIGPPTVACVAGDGEFDAFGPMSIKITGPGGGTLLSASPGVTRDLSITFLVSTSGAVMSGLTVRISGSASAGGSFAVGEHVTDYLTIPSPSFNLALAANNITPDDSVSFAAQSDLFIDKDIMLQGGTGTTGSQIDYVIQELATAVPEPSGLSVLLLAGAAGFASRRRKNPNRAVRGGIAANAASN